MSFLSQISRIFRDKFSFFVPYLIFLCCGAAFLYLLSKGSLVIFLNNNHRPAFDFIFYYATLCGDGIFYLLIIIGLLFYRIRYALYGFISFLGSGIIVQILKYITDIPRPKVFFGDLVVLAHVQGVQIYSYGSFPSGHSASAFSLFLLLTIIFRNKYIGGVFFTCAFIIALSRVYLAQHFLIDIYFGSVIGIIVTILTYIIFENWHKFTDSKLYGMRLINK